MKHLLLAIFGAAAVVLTSDIGPSTPIRGVACASGSRACAPDGATSDSVPGLGSPEFSRLFINLIQSPVPNLQRSIQDTVTTERSLLPLCCGEGLSCLVLYDFSIPFCYDKFTTAFFLPDGSFGTIVGGIYNSSNNIADLITGDYALANGITGNIYSAGVVASPTTATTTTPAQPTVSSGVPSPTGSSEGGTEGGKKSSAERRGHSLSACIVALFALFLLR